MVSSPNVVLGLRELDLVGHGLSLICGLLFRLWRRCLNLLFVGEGLGCLITSFVVFIEMCSAVPAKRSYTKCFNLFIGFPGCCLVSRPDVKGVCVRCVRTQA